MKRGGVFEGSKAQITVFLIIGIIMLFSVGVVIYLKNTGISTDKFMQPKSPPVEAFIQQCLEKTAREALVAVGEQGGYLTLPPQISANPTRYVSLISGIGGPYVPKIPYWYYEGRTEIPGLPYIENEIEAYVQQNVHYCINNFTGLKTEFDIQYKDDYVAEVLLGDWDTQVKLNWEVEITPRGSEETIKKDLFMVKLNVPLGRMWSMAKQILEAENKQAFFEKMTINLMASHPPEDIPFTGLDLHCGKKVWHMSNVKSKINYALPPAISGIRFRKTNHIPWEDPTEEVYKKIAEALDEYKSRKTLDMTKDSSGKIMNVVPPKLPKNIPSDSYDYFQYYFNFTEEDYQAFTVASTYKPEWGMQFVATPNQYGMMQSGVQDLKSQIMSFLCLNTYHFVYDVVYPVTIHISYPDAFFGQGYTFRFAFPVQIFHNQADRNLKPARIIEPIEYDIDPCESYGTEKRQIIVRDSSTYAEISGVNLTFDCIRQQCELGETETNNRHFIWEGYFPSGCYAPVIIAKKDNYLETKKQFDYSEPFYIDMHPTQTVEFQVKRVAENAPQASKFLEPNMHAIVNIEHDDPPLSLYSMFDSEGQFTKPQKTVYKDVKGIDYSFPTTFDLLREDATYYVNVLLLERLNDQTDIMIGGWVGNWTVKAWEVQDAKKVVFNVMQKYPKPTSMKDLNQMMGVYNLIYNRSAYPDVQPEIIRYDSPDEVES